MRDLVSPALSPALSGMGSSPPSLPPPPCTEQMVGRWMDVNDSGQLNPVGQTEMPLRNDLLPFSCASVGESLATDGFNHKLAAEAEFSQPGDRRSAPLKRVSLSTLCPKRCTESAAFCPVPALKSPAC